MRVLRMERAPRKYEWDARARRALEGVSVFFSKWKSHGGLRAASAEIFWVRTAADSMEALEREILADPLDRVSRESSAYPDPAAVGRAWWCLEKSFRPGVTDNAGHVLAEAIRLVAGIEAECRSGSRLWIELPLGVGRAEVEEYARHVFYNDLIERAQARTEDEARAADAALFARPEWPEVRVDAGPVERFDLSAMGLDALEKLSRERLWAFSREELAAVQKHFEGLGRPATDVEIEVLAQTWSEHCKHKIFAADIEVTNERRDVDLPRRVESVFKTYIRGATEKIPAPFLKSVFEDNAGIVAMTDEWDCAIKVETHNSPSALDPYGGALTGIVGVNRDILGAGMGAQPIANLDVFCVGPLDLPDGELPPRLHHPRRILEGVRSGVQDGGNKSGIPTVTGAVVHDIGFLGKPLVFCGTLGLLPANSGRDLIRKEVCPGDAIVMVGGRIGKDGIHGATFSSLEMNEASPVSAVQLGDPLTQRRVWDFLLEARDQGFYRAVTDNGAGGLSSSIGEMARLCGRRGGARMDVGKAPTKYEGLRPFELTVSESQERMSLAVKPERLTELLELAARRGVECSVLGEFEDSGEFHVLHRGETVARLGMEFLHNGVPRMKLKARVKKPEAATSPEAPPHAEAAPAAPAAGRPTKLTIREELLERLSHANVCSRAWLVRQYDHEVQGRTVRKPYGSPGQKSPGDGATLRLSRESFEGVALGLGLAPEVAARDPKAAAERALDEAVRNAVAAGMDPAHAALVDNFCWPDPLPGESNPDAEEKLGALVVTCKRLFDGAVALGMPFVSGKDSMKNDYRMGSVKISVPPTVLITAMGKVHDVRRVPRGHAASGPGPRRVLWLKGQEGEYDFTRARTFFAAFHALVREGRIESAHDVSDGGWLATTVEMLLGTGIGAELNVETLRDRGDGWGLFAEPATSFVVLAREGDAPRILTAFSDFEPLDMGRLVQTRAGAARLTLRDGGREAASWTLGELEGSYEHGQP